LSSDCYAYRKNGCAETWYRHTTDVVECIRSRWETEAFVRKASNVLGVDADIVRDFLLLAGFLHDIAKTDIDQQRRCADECAAFPKHWYASAMVALWLGLDAGILGDSYGGIIVNVFEGAKQNYDVGDAYILLVFMPVLFHNYVHLSEEALFDLHGYLGTYVKGMYTVAEGCRAQITMAADRVIETLRTEAAKRLLNRLRNHVNSAGTLGGAVLGEKALRVIALGYGRIEGARIKYVAEAATGLLNMCDGRVAYSNRRCSESA